MPRPFSAARTALTVAREAPASAASCSCVSGISVSSAPPAYTAARSTEPAQDAFLGALVVRVGHELVHAPQLVGEQRDEHAVDARMDRAQSVELAPQHAHRLGGLEGVDRRRSPPGRHERELAECVARPSHHEQRLLTEPRRALDRKAAADDEVQRISRIRFVEDDLAALEPAAPRDAEHALDVVVGHPGKQLPAHVPSVLLMSNC